MQNWVRDKRYEILAVILLGVLTQCSEKPELDGEILISPAEQIVEIGASAQFGAIIKDHGDQRVRWEVSGSQENGSIEQNGLYKAPGELPNDPTVKLSATSLDDPSLVAEATVRLVPPGAAGIIGLTLSPNDTNLSIGDTQTFTALGHLSDNTTRDVSALVEWSSSQESIVTISSSGEAFAVSSGSAEIEAELGALSAFAEVEVGASFAVVDIEISPSPAVVAPGDNKELRATARLFDGSTLDITEAAAWSIGDPAVATVGNSTDQKGELIGVNPGATQVFVNFEGLTSSAQVFCSLEADRCDDNLDNDQDGLLDCQDPDCQGEDCGIQAEVCQNESNDFSDDDQDGLLDCQDPDCSGDFVCNAGSQEVGQGCDSHNDCQASQSSPACLEEALDVSFVGGYCSEFCSLAIQTCGAQGLCEDVGFGGGFGLCFSSCVIDDQNPAPQGNCRSGYQCTDFFFSPNDLLCYPL